MQASVLNEYIQIQIQIQIQLYWPGLRTNEEFDFGPLALYVQHLTYTTHNI